MIASLVPVRLPRHDAIALVDMQACDDEGRDVEVERPCLGRHGLDGHGERRAGICRALSGSRRYPNHVVRDGVPGWLDAVKRGVVADHWEEDQCLILRAVGDSVVHAADADGLRDVPVAAVKLQRGRRQELELLGVADGDGEGHGVGWAAGEGDGEVDLAPELVHD